MKKLFLFFLLFSFVFSPVWAAEPPKLNGQWAGPLKVPGGELKLILTIVPLTNGSYYAALDLPQQRISRMPATATVKGTDITVSIEQAGSRFEGKILKNGTTLQGTWSQPGLKGPLTLTRLKATKPAAVAGKPRLTPPYREEEVSFYNKDAQIRLAGTLTTPAGPGPFPAVVLLSDSGPHDRDVAEQDYRLFGSLADHLTRRGIAVLRFDDRGVGQSQGSHFNTTTADVVSDAQAALVFLRSRRLFDARYLGLLGHGEGANVALLAAAESGPAAPAFVVALAPYGVPGRSIIQRQQLEILRLIGSNPAQVKAALALNQEMISIIRQTPNDNQARGKVAGLLRFNNTDLDPHMARARAVQLTSPWSRYFLDFDPTRTLGQVACPVLLLSGADDLQVAANQNQTPLRKGLKSTLVTSRRLAGVNHWFQPEMKDWPVVNGEQQPVFSPKALTEIREWIFKHTERPKPAPTTDDPPKKQLVKGSSSGKMSR
ncbi:alpha/beta hydrolase family protein [Hymenobacter psychrophilus]|uniref:Serine aminopeptidase S33 domain-containing protein n=1 Tax=Hymenobacter psychrophilus TaxID=651662 RepID=A0A1H3NPL4_9BACT|nr:alpha/beta hydrolase [Hymenobacter psychrophilus]SDY90703.1 hypothetical protein SAMN04488069_11823 [Hymenobacter psychrophilus]